MKRSPLRRKAPLAPGSSEMKRGSGLPGNKTPLHRTPINPVSRKRRRDNAERTKTVSAMRAANRGQCARCGQSGLPVFGHERLARSQGGSILAPDCVLDNECNRWCEDNPREAAWTGWKVSSKWPHDPALEIGQAWDLAGNIVTFETGTHDEIEGVG